MTTQKLEHGARHVKRGREITRPRRTGRKFRRAELEAELKTKGRVSLAERKIVEFLAPLLRAGAKPISHKAIIEGAQIFAASMTPALRRAIDHEFLCRDTTTKPHTWSLHERWFEVS